MKLVEVDPIHPQTPQAPLARRPQMLGSAVGRPSAGPRAREPTLRRDHEPARIGVKCLGDQALAHLGAVRVRRVDQVHPQLEGAPQDRPALVRVGGLPQTPAPVIRIAPNPRRLTSNPSRQNTPAAEAPPAGVTASRCRCCRALRSHPRSSRAWPVQVGVASMDDRARRQADGGSPRASASVRCGWRRQATAGQPRPCASASRSASTASASRSAATIWITRAAPFSLGMYPYHPIGRPWRRTKRHTMGPATLPIAAT